MHTQAIDLPGFRVVTGRHQAGEELPSHHHDDPTLCFLLNGRFTEYSRNLATDCVSGTIKLMPAGEVHWNRFVAPETFGVRVDIDRSRFASSPRLLELLDAHHVFDSPSPRLLMQRLVNELHSRDEASTVVIEGLLLELLGELARAEQAGHRTMPSWLRRANDVVHAQYATNISLSRVAHQVGIAPATLARAYRVAYHVSIGERIRQLRLEQAARALLESLDPISMVAARAGFYDQSHFTSAFRRRFAMTPARYRALHGARQR